MVVPAPMTALRWSSRLTGGRIVFSLPAAPTERIALTFDDGPHPEVTPHVLDALAASRARATFFFQGSAAKTAPDLVRRAQREGHLVAAHGMTHYSARTQSAAQALRNAADCHALLEQTVQATLPRLYRPPYGELTVASLVALLRDDFTLAFWDYDSNDSFVASHDALLGRLRDAPPPPRSIVLFHDDYEVTARALPTVLAGLAARGLETVCPGDSQT